MQAVVFPSPEHVEVQSVPEPACGPDDVIVKVSTCGLCGTDLHISRNEYLSGFPLIPGHEFVGTVVEAGIDAHAVKVGDRVAVDPNLYCGECDECRRQHNNHCLNWQGVGVTRAGGFAEYVVVPARACYRVPEGMSDLEAAFIEPVSCVMHALNRIRLRPADDVLIFGAGPMGLLLVQAMRHSGASRITVIEKQEQRRAMALQMGANEAHAPTTIANEKFGFVIDATGAPAVIEQALGWLRPRGTYLQFGVAPMKASVSWKPYDIFKNDWTIVGSFALCYTFQQAIAWMEAGVIDVKPLVSHTLPLSEFPSALQAFAKGETLKVHLRP
jgi:2-desacetyl-2-hydroxyethyl bacteriochlorophyllide A dehydrogenase